MIKEQLKTELKKHKTQLRRKSLATKYIGF